jgi:cell filamentation protein
VYDAVEDPYYYPGTTVLRNRAGLRDQAQLDAFELDMTTQRTAEPLPSGRLDARHYRAIHRHCSATCIPGPADTAQCASPKTAAPSPTRRTSIARWRGLPATDFAREAAHFLAELNAIHPFRTGNERASLAFLTLLAAQADHPLNMERLEPDAMLRAAIKSFFGRDERLMA